MYGRSAALARGDYLRSARGDPGIFSFLGKAVGTIARVGSKILPGPAGAILGTVGGFLGGRAARPTPPAGFAPMQTSMTGLQLGGPRGITLGVQRTQAVTASARVQNGGGGCPSGYHLNKSGYYDRSGFVPPGSRCVRNRRMNVANPRALRKGLRRVAGFGKLASRARRDIGRAATAVGVRRSVRKGAFGRKR